MSNRMSRRTFLSAAVAGLTANEAAACWRSIQSASSNKKQRGKSTTLPRQCRESGGNPTIVRHGVRNARPVWARAIRWD